MERVRRLQRQVEASHRIARPPEVIRLKAQTCVQPGVQMFGEQT